MTPCQHQRLDHLTHGLCEACGEPVDRRKLCPSCHALVRGVEAACPRCSVPCPAGGWPGLPRRYEGLELLMRLGQGHLTVVYAARAATGELLACRVVPRPGERSADIVAAYEEEVVRARLFQDYDGILQATKAGLCDQGWPYLVMDFSPGQTLAQVLGVPTGDDRFNPAREEALPALRTVRLLRRLLGAAARLHRNRLVHRSIKPSNIFVEQSERGERVRLGDLAGAGAFSEQELEAGEERPGGAPLDPAYISPASAPYIAPEVARGATPLLPRCDIYSAGVVAYELCTGRLPYQISRSLAFQPVEGLAPGLCSDRWGEFAAAWFRAHLSAELIPPRELNPDLPASLERCLLRCLARRPEERYQRAGEVIVQLALVEHELCRAQDLPAGDPDILAAVMPARGRTAGGGDEATAMELVRLRTANTDLRTRVSRLARENARLQERVDHMEHTPRPGPGLPHPALLGAPPELHRGAEVPRAAEDVPPPAAPAVGLPHPALLGVPPPRARPDAPAPLPHPALLGAPPVLPGATVEGAQEPQLAPRRTRFLSDAQAQTSVAPSGEEPPAAGEAAEGARRRTREREEPPAAARGPSSREAVPEPPGPSAAVGPEAGPPRRRKPFGQGAVDLDTRVDTAGPVGVVAGWPDGADPDQSPEPDPAGEALAPPDEAQDDLLDEEEDRGQGTTLISEEELLLQSQGQRPGAFGGDGEMDIRTTVLRKDRGDHE